MTADNTFIRPEWPAPANVVALSSTRAGGHSQQAPFASANFGEHVGDEAAAVAANRQLLAQAAGISNIGWLQQVHGINVCWFHTGQKPVADGLITAQPQTAVAITTADCLPLLLCNSTGTTVAAVHCGWRSLAGGIIRQAVTKLDTAPEQLLAWLGPCIGPQAFEVGGEVHAAFTATNSHSETAFKAVANNRYLANLRLLAKQALNAAGVRAVYSDTNCTFSQPQRFFSYRRDGITGRMVTAIGLLA